MSLLEEVKIILRVSSEVYDPEVQMLIDAAIADMKRVGIEESLLDPESLEAQAKMAVACYCKAHFGFDNSEQEAFDSIYRQKVVDLLNSPANAAAGDAE